LNLFLSSEFPVRPFDDACHVANNEWLTEGGILVDRLRREKQSAEMALGSKEIHFRLSIPGSAVASINRASLSIAATYRLPTDWAGTHPSKGGDAGHAGRRVHALGVMIGSTLCQNENGRPSPWLHLLI
jgi:hypothetical protein